MTTNPAQDEFNELLRDKDHSHAHPEDRNHDSDLSDPESPGAQADRREIIDTDDELDIPSDMRSNNYHIPSLRAEANTGPKGVIADAQAFEQAKKRARRFTWKKGGAGAARQAPASYSVSAYHDEKSSDEESDESFLREWRQMRLQELQNVSQRLRSRTNSPSRRIYGSLTLVDAEGYLDAIDKTSSGTMVVVFIYETNNNKEESYKNSQTFETIMKEVAKRNDTVRFIKMPNEIAEIEGQGVPAVLAYKAGDKFADIVALQTALPHDSEVSAVSVETVLRQHRIL